MGDIELQTFSDRLKELRTSLNLTQVQFVEDLGITAAALSAYEKNQKNPSISVAKRIAEEYNVSLDWLCGLSDKKNSTTTYSDIIKCCLNYQNPTFQLSNILESFNKNITEFQHKLGHMKTLLNEKTIDNDLYDLWLEKEIDKYNKPIYYIYEKPVNIFSTEEE